MRLLSHSQTLMTGTYRAGTEFVSLLASNHPRLSSTMYHINAMRFLVGKFDPIASSRMMRKALEATKERLAERYDLQLDIDDFSRLYLAGRDITYGLLYDALMSHFWLKDSKTHWIEKVQLAWRELPDFLEMMENGRAILIIRDPRSVLASFKRYTYAPPPAYLGAIFNCQDAMRRAVQFVDEISPDRFMLVQYELAAVEPEKTANDIYTFIGLDPEESRYDPASWCDCHGQRWRANSSFHTTRSPFDVTKAILRWHDNLENWEIAFTDYVCGKFYGAFNYQPANIEVDWEVVEAQIGNDPQIRRFLEQFHTTGEGVQAFPTDPTVKESWEENFARTEA